MNPCDECLLDDKIYECCGRFPETGETAVLEIPSSGKILACPYLDVYGKCRIYDSRPLPCQAHFCFTYNTPRAVDAGFENFNLPFALQDNDEKEPSY